MWTCVFSNFYAALPYGESGPWEDVNDKVSEALSAGDYDQNDLVSETQANLLSMLRTQSGYVSASTPLKHTLMLESFGSAVGAPIVFFTGGFAYTIADTLSQLGDNDTAHALAFGM